MSTFTIRPLLSWPHRGQPHWHNLPGTPKILAKTTQLTTNSPCKNLIQTFTFSRIQSQHCSKSCHYPQAEREDQRLCSGPARQCVLPTSVAKTGHQHHLHSGQRSRKWREPWSPAQTCPVVEAQTTEQDMVWFTGVPANASQSHNALPQWSTMAGPPGIITHA